MLGLNCPYSLKYNKVASEKQNKMIPSCSFEHRIRGAGFSWSIQRVSMGCGVAREVFKPFRHFSFIRKPLECEIFLGSEWKERIVRGCGGEDWFVRQAHPSTVDQGADIRF